MRKILTVLSLVTVLTFSGCTSNVNPVLKGSYQSEREGVGYIVEISFHSDDSSFVEHIENREVDRGTYEKIKNNVYKMKSDKQNIEITLNAENSFEIIVKKLNNSKPIQLKNVSAIPVEFTTIFSDVDEYRTLLD